MSQQPKKSNLPPVYAVIVEANDERTVAALVLFDRRVRREFNGPTHLADARAWVDAWCAYLAHEWTEVKETTAIMMDVFIKGLKNRGVPDEVITASIEDLINYA